MPYNRCIDSRVIGILTSPRATYAKVAAEPFWFQVLAGMLVLAATASVIVFSTDVGQQAWLDQRVRMMESFGIAVSDDTYERMLAGAGQAALLSAGLQVLLLALVPLAVAGIAFIVFARSASFTQVFAVVVYSGIVLCVRQIVVLASGYARGSISSPTNLGVFFPMLDETTFTARVLGTIDLFLVWWAVSLAIGLSVLYTRPARSIAAAIMAAYVTIAAAIAAVQSALSVA
jgi:hypothetical protein